MSSSTVSVQSAGETSGELKDDPVDDDEMQLSSSHLANQQSHQPPLQASLRSDVSDELLDLRNDLRNNSPKAFRKPSKASEEQTTAQSPRRLHSRRSSHPEEIPSPPQSTALSIRQRRRSKASSSSHHETTNDAASVTSRSSAVRRRRPRSRDPTREAAASPTRQSSSQRHRSRSRDGASHRNNLSPTSRSSQHRPGVSRSRSSTLQQEDSSTAVTSSHHHHKKLERSTSTRVKSKALLEDPSGERRPARVRSKAAAIEGGSSRGGGNSSSSTLMRRHRSLSRDAETKRNQSAQQSTTMRRQRSSSRDAATLASRPRSRSRDKSSSHYASRTASKSPSRAIHQNRRHKSPTSNRRSVHGDTEVPPPPPSLDRNEEEPSPSLRDHISRKEPHGHHNSDHRKHHHHHSAQDHHDSSMSSLAPDVASSRRKNKSMIIEDEEEASTAIPPTPKAAAPPTRSASTKLHRGRRPRPPEKSKSNLSSSQQPRSNNSHKVATSTTSRSKSTTRPHTSPVRSPPGKAVSSRSLRHRKPATASSPRVDDDVTSPIKHNQGLLFSPTAGGLGSPSSTKGRDSPGSHHRGRISPGSHHKGRDSPSSVRSRSSAGSSKGRVSPRHPKSSIPRVPFDSDNVATRPSSTRSMDSQKSPRSGSLRQSSRSNRQISSPRESPGNSASTHKIKNSKHSVIGLDSSHRPSSLPNVVEDEDGNTHTSSSPAHSKKPSSTRSQQEQRPRSDRSHTSKTQPNSERSAGSSQPVSDRFSDHSASRHRISCESPIPPIRKPSMAAVVKKVEPSLDELFQAERQKSTLETLLSLPSEGTTRGSSASVAADYSWGQSAPDLASVGAPSIVSSPDPHTRNGRHNHGTHAGNLTSRLGQHLNLGMRSWGNLASFMTAQPTDHASIASSGKTGGGNNDSGSELGSLGSGSGPPSRGLKKSNSFGDVASFLGVGKKKPAPPPASSVRRGRKPSHWNNEAATIQPMPLAAAVVTTSAANAGEDIKIIRATHDGLDTSTFHEKDFLSKKNNDQEDDTEFDGSTTFREDDDDGAEPEYLQLCLPSSTNTMTTATDTSLTDSPIRSPEQTAAGGIFQRFRASNPTPAGATRKALLPPFRRKKVEGEQ